MMSQTAYGELDAYSLEQEAHMSLQEAIVSFESRTTKFHIDNPDDHIQGFHKRGSFYELRQMLAHRDLISMGSTVVDVGANIGNHTIFYASFTYAKCIYPIEPNHRSRRLLETNIRANIGTRAKIATDHLGIAVGAEAGNAKIVDGPADNLGGAKLALTSEAETNVTVPVQPLDSLEFEGPISFVKIDVEGMELDVLAGARLLFEKHRPAVAVEILDKHDRQFWEWAGASKYQVIGSFVDYLRFKNYILIPAY